MSHRLADLLNQLEQAYQCGEYGRAVFQADQLLENPDYAAKRAFILCIKASALVMLGPTWDGTSMSLLREALGAVGRDKAIKARILGALGGLYGRLGDVTKYNEVIKQFLRLAPEKNPQVRRYGAFVWFNYGVALENCFRYTEAVEALETAAEIAKEFGLAMLHRLALHNIGGVQLYAGNLAAAAEAMAMVQALQVPDKEFGHKLLSRQAEYTYAIGDYVSAQQWITEALLHPSADDRTKADVHFTWAQTLLALGRPEQAREKAMTALDYAFKEKYIAGLYKFNRFLQQLGS